MNCLFNQSLFYKLQISVTDEHKKLPKGSYQVRLFDDESYSELRKVSLNLVQKLRFNYMKYICINLMCLYETITIQAQRSGTEDASVAALATIDIAHKVLFTFLRKFEFVIQMFFTKSHLRQPQGTSRGPWVQTEHIATAAAILVCNLAHTVRRQL